MNILQVPILCAALADKIIEPQTDTSISEATESKGEGQPCGCLRLPNCLVRATRGCSTHAPAFESFLAIRMMARRKGKR